jgi:hypothetical protein
MKDPFYANLKEVASDEKEHVDFLTSALMGMPLSFNPRDNAHYFNIFQLLVLLPLPAARTSSHPLMSAASWPLPAFLGVKYIQLYQ